MKQRILTGDRPTGKLHLGHYVGSLANRVRLQDEYECFFLIADYHALTTAYEDPSEIGANVRELVLDLKLETASLGLLSYPVLQAADIMMVRAHLVPVGKDQASHLEVTRELARRFNELYEAVFPIPETLIGEVPTLVGTDGQAKMSKSLNNAVLLSEEPDDLQKKVMSMYTDPTRLRATDPGHVEGNPVFQYHDAFNDDRSEVEDLKERYRQGRGGD